MQFNPESKCKSCARIVTRIEIDTVIARVTARLGEVPADLSRVEREIGVDEANLIRAWLQRKEWWK